MIFLTVATVIEPIIIYASKFNGLIIENSQIKEGSKEAKTKLYKTGFQTVKVNTFWLELKPTCYGKG